MAEQCSCWTLARALDAAYRGKPQPPCPVHDTAEPSFLTTAIAARRRPPVPDDGSGRSFLAQAVSARLPRRPAGAAETTDTDDQENNDDV